ncbi:MAG: hypothetical protein KJ635_01480 [Proteobacteria bacterium]|nr:hypothetical protein [Pseudomonadota bacterium]
MRLKGRDEVLRRENSFEQGSLTRREVIYLAKVKCIAKTKEGKACKSFAAGKSKRCASHKKK